MRSSCNFISIHKSLPSTVNTAIYIFNSWPHSDMHTCIICTTTSTGMPPPCMCMLFISMMIIRVSEERIIQKYAHACVCVPRLLFAIRRPFIFYIGADYDMEDLTVHVMASTHVLNLSLPLEATPCLCTFYNTTGSKQASLYILSYFLSETNLLASSS